MENFKWAHQIISFYKWFAWWKFSCFSNMKWSCEMWNCHNVNCLRERELCVPLVRLTLTLSSLCASSLQPKQDNRWWSVLPKQNKLHLFYFQWKMWHLKMVSALKCNSSDKFAFYLIIWSQLMYIMFTMFDKATFNIVAMVINMDAGCYPWNRQVACCLINVFLLFSNWLCFFINNFIISLISSQNNLLKYGCWMLFFQWRRRFGVTLGFIPPLWNRLGWLLMNVFVGQPGSICSLCLCPNIHCKATFYINIFFKLI